MLAVGFFDGVHAGHCRVLAGAIAAARRRSGQAWALTFAQHPLAVLAPELQPPLLTPLEVRLERLAAACRDRPVSTISMAALFFLTPTVDEATLIPSHRCRTNEGVHINETGGVNLYAVCHNNPVSLVDYLGQGVLTDWFTDWIKKALVKKSAKKVCHEYDDYKQYCDDLRAGNVREDELHTACTLCALYQCAGEMQMDACVKAKYATCMKVYQPRLL